MQIKVSDVMTRNVLWMSPETSAQEVASHMRDKRISSVVIVKGGKTVGIVTEHDLAERVTALGLNPKTTPASLIMSSPVVIIDVEAGIDEAARLMRDKRIKKLIAVKDGKTEGIVTSYDLIVAQPVIRLLGEKK